MSILNKKRHIPVVQDACDTVRKGTTFTKAWRIRNAFGESFDFTAKDMNVVCRIYSDPICHCLVETCPVEVFDCSDICLTLQCHFTETLKACSTLYYQINYEPSWKADGDRCVTVKELEKTMFRKDLKLNDYRTMSALHKIIDNPPGAFRLVNGSLKVSA